MGGDPNQLTVAIITTLLTILLGVALVYSNIECKKEVAR